MLLTPILCNEFPDELLACKPFDSGTHLREPKLKHLNLGVSFFFNMHIYLCIVFILLLPVEIFSWIPLYCIHTLVYFIDKFAFDLVSVNVLAFNRVVQCCPLMS